MRELFERPEHWHYYMNLMGREFPLRTNQELVKILKAYNGSNDVDGSHHRYVTYSQPAISSNVRIAASVVADVEYFCCLFLVFAINNILYVT